MVVENPPDYILGIESKFEWWVGRRVWEHAVPSYIVCSEVDIFEAMAKFAVRI